MCPGPLTRIGPLLAFARSKSRWTLMPSPFRNRGATLAGVPGRRRAPGQRRSFSFEPFVDGDLLNLKSAAANGLTGPGEGTPRSP